MSTDTVSPLRQRMIEDMNARKLCAGTQRGHIRGCKRFAAFLKRSPETATAEDIRQFQLQLKLADILGRSRFGGPLEKRREPLAAADMAPLRAGTQLARVHVLDHALTQRADGI